MKTKAILPAVVLFLAGGSAVPASTADFKVIVHGGVAGNAITKENVAEIYLGKVVRWKDRSVITAVDQSATSPLRATFSEAVLGMPVFAVQTHWMRQMSTGARPPISKSTDAEVIELVASKPGSIGYVSGDATLPATVRALSLQ